MGVKEHQKSIESAMSRLDELVAEKNRLYEELKESLAIQLLWPDVFKHGSVRSILEGHPSSPSKMRLVLSNEKEERRFPLEEVPSIVMKRHLQKNFHTHEAWKIREYLARVRRRREQTEGE